MRARIMVGDCAERLRELEPESIDAVVTDPPYGLGFMGKAWDHAVPSADVWREVFRVLKPGGVVLDPFMGSGSTGKAAALEGFDFIGCELDPVHAEIAELRIVGAGGLFCQLESDRK